MQAEVPAGDMLELLKDFVAVVLALKDASGRRRQQVVERNLEPLLAQLRSVHEHYLSTFRAYRDELRGGAPALHVIDRIQTDVRWSDADRALARQLAEHLLNFSDARPNAQKEALRLFAWTVVLYLMYRNDEPRNDDTFLCAFPNRTEPNAPRQFLLRRLRQVSGLPSLEEQKRQATAAVDEAIDVLQDNMKWANDYYLRAKTALA